MKNALRIVLLVVTAFSFAYAQGPVAKVKIEAVTPHQLTTLGLSTTPNSVSTGLNVVAKSTFVYLSPRNTGDTSAIQSATWEVKKSTTVITTTPLEDNWAYFQPTQVGAYTVVLTVTTSTGTDQDTISVYSANFIGVGNFEGVEDPDGQSCMGCHAEGDHNFTAIFDEWKESGHAIVFQRELETSTHYSTSCMRCHTTGYDHNSVASNGGFDDVAVTAGWVYSNPTNSTKWDSILTDFPDLVNLGTIGCEACHGPGNQHSSGGDPNKIAISIENGACIQCHDEPGRHNKYAEYEKSLHAEALWSNSFKRNTPDNSLGTNCGRCHDGNAYVTFTKGGVFDGNTLSAANHVAITCATCHEWLIDVV